MYLPELQQIDKQRRLFATSMVILPVAFCFAAAEPAPRPESQIPLIPKERTLSLVRYGQRYNDIPFADTDGKIIKDGYEYLSRIFGDYKSNSAILIDPNLFMMLSLSQEYLRLNGHSDPSWIVNSGYRTWKTNSHTEGASQNSMHPLGKATDGKFKNVDPLLTGKILRYYGGQGIGIYSSFVHADTGRLRAWYGSY